ncbi:heterokaryon incompatibility protein-domain-containing protein [Leptodontidium sp. 2 PMI_412]|nr:heterokaryon incompatibility protein-domain-containing protein [Leptodontidium sp. 2 PMI_412]
MLHCDRCDILYRGHNESFESDPLDIPSLKAGVESGCSTCTRILQILPRLYGSEENWKAQYCVIPQRRSGGYLHYLIGQQDIEDTSVSPIDDIHEILVVSTSRVEVDLTIQKRASISLLESTRVAEKWLRCCLKEHGECRAYNYTTHPPTRLLELRDLDMRLVIPAEQDNFCHRYIALSYCWGKNPNFLRLEDSNLDELRKGIAYDRLPTAFNEAIDLIKSLSISYVWIDCLCIIQGNPEDWVYESARMKDVYSNCLMNISLSQAANPHESCLEGTTPRAGFPFLLKVDGKANSQTDGESSSDESPDVVFRGDYFSKALNNLPLGSRGWALQERLLAPRVLSFGKGEMFWDCRQLKNASETFPNGFGTLSTLLGTRGSSIKNFPSTTQRFNIEKAWGEILENYTSRELTYPEKDKLVAISAAAARMGELLFDDTYIAGHFGSMGARSLNWQVKHPQGPERDKRSRRIRWQDADGREVRSRFPSWSWASMDGPLYGLADIVDEDADEVVFFKAQAFGWNVTPIGLGNPTGDVNFASFILKGPCLEMEVVGQRVVGPEVWSSLEKPPPITCTWDDPDDEPKEVKRFLLFVLVDDQTEVTIDGLVLEHVTAEEDAFYRRTEAEDTAYRRMGHFRCDGYFLALKASEKYITLV